jgi:hypothetical protein
MKNMAGQIGQFEGFFSHGKKLNLQFLLIKFKLCDLIEQLPVAGTWLRRRTEKKIKEWDEINCRIADEILALDRNVITLSELRNIAFRMNDRKVIEEMLEFFNPNCISINLDKIKLERVSDNSWEIYNEERDNWRKVMTTIYHLPMKLGDIISLESEETFYLIREAQNKAENTLYKIRGLQNQGEEHDFFYDLEPDVTGKVRQIIMEIYGTSCAVGYQQIKDILQKIEDLEIAGLINDL